MLTEPTIGGGANEGTGTTPEPRDDAFISWQRVAQMLAVDGVPPSFKQIRDWCVIGTRIGGKRVKMRRRGYPGGYRYTEADVRDFIKACDAAGACDESEQGEAMARESGVGEVRHANEGFNVIEEIIEQTKYPPLRRTLGRTQEHARGGPAGRGVPGR